MAAGTYAYSSLRVYILITLIYFLDTFVLEQIEVILDQQACKWETATASPYSF